VDEVVQLCSCRMLFCRVKALKGSPQMREGVV
jgi:hypothetical protein